MPSFERMCTVVLRDLLTQGCCPILPSTKDQICHRASFATRRVDKVVG
jgi:hypothetical protein